MTGEGRTGRPGACGTYAGYQRHISGGEHTCVECKAAFHRLIMFEPLGPLTDDPDEWMEVTDGLWQSRRKSSAFSCDGGKTYHVNGEHDTIRTTQRSKK